MMDRSSESWYHSAMDDVSTVSELNFVQTSKGNLRADASVCASARRELSHRGEDR